MVGVMNKGYPRKYKLRLLCVLSADKDMNISQMRLLCFPKGRLVRIQESLSPFFLGCQYNLVWSVAISICSGKYVTPEFTLRTNK